MTDLPSTISSDLAGYYEFVAAQAHKWVDPLTQQQFWHNPYTYGNSVGHLILHLTGNLNYYIGARVAETGYVRHRDREFTASEKLEKKEVLHAFDRAIAMVVAAIRKQEPADWLKPYSAEREPEAAERFMIFLRCAGHAYHHVGQIIFLSKELTKEAEPRSASALSKDAGNRGREPSSGATCEQEGDVEGQGGTPHFSVWNRQPLFPLWSCMVGTCIWHWPSSASAWPLDFSGGQEKPEPMNSKPRLGEKTVRKFVLDGPIPDDELFAEPAPRRSAAGARSRCLAFFHTDDRPVSGDEKRVQPADVARWKARGIRSLAHELGRQRLRARFVDCRHVNWRRPPTDGLEKIEHECRVVPGRQVDRVSLRPSGTNFRHSGREKTDLRDFGGRRRSPATHKSRNGSE